MRTTSRFTVAGGAALVAAGVGLSAAPVTAQERCVATFIEAHGDFNPLREYSFPVPDGVTEITVDAFGAQGGDVSVDFRRGSGGLGAHARAIVAVAPGDTLEIVVGSAGQNVLSIFDDIPGGGFPDGGDGGGSETGGISGAGGGGSSRVQGAGFLVVAAGGGGGAYDGHGGTGGAIGAKGGDASDGVATGGEAGGNGGAGGAGASDTGTFPPFGGDGGPLQGGRGGFGGSGDSGGGGGGGGGFVGGGGGGGGRAISPDPHSRGAGGGGGSSGGPAGTIFGTGLPGDGFVRLTYEAPGCGEADLALSKTAIVDEDAIVVFDLVLRNLGPDQATGIAVTDELPACTTYVSDDCDGEVSGERFSWNVGNLLPPGEPFSVVTCRVTVDASACVGVQTNTATVEGEQGDPDTENNRAEVSFVVAPGADLALSTAAIVIDEPVPDPPVDVPVVVSLQARNQGPDDATGVAVTAQLPACTSFVQGSEGVAVDNGTLTCDIGDLTSGDSASCGVVLEASACSGEQTYTASVAGAENDPNPDNNTAQGAFTIEPGGGEPPDDLTFRYDFAEGATGFFTTALGLFNPSRTDPVSVEVTLLPDGAAPVVLPFDLDPLTRASVDFDAEIGEPTGIAAVVRATGPISAMRQTHWDDSVFGSTLESGAPGPSTVHYFAEGATTLWDLFFLLSNDNDTDAEVTIQYLPLTGGPIVQEVTVPAHARRTIWANAVPGMEDNQAGAIVTSNVPIASERAMYLTGTGAAWRAGASSRGAHALHETWFFAECATTFFDCFLLLANPATTATANVQVVYQLPTGETIMKNHIVPASQRRTILVAAEDPALVETTMAMRVTSDVPIVAERAMWWGPNPLFWYESNATLGSTEAGTVWGVGEAWSGGPSVEDAFVLVSNAGEETAQVKLTVIYDDGSHEEQEYTLPGDARATFFIGGEFPATEGRRFSVLVESLGGDSAMPIIVDVSRYQSTGGRFGNAGGSTTATKIQ